jgi:hypothetical protein
MNYVVKLLIPTLLATGARLMMPLLTSLTVVGDGVWGVQKDQSATSIHVLCCLLLTLLLELITQANFDFSKHCSRDPWSRTSQL